MHSNTYKKILCGGMAALMLAMTGCTAMDQLKLLIGRDLDIPQPTPKPTVTVEYGSEGYTVEVYERYIVFTGYNFSTGKKIPAACLLMPTDVNAPFVEEEVSAEESHGEASAETSLPAQNQPPAEEPFPWGIVAGGAAVVGAAVGVAVALKKKKK